MKYTRVQFYFLFFASACLSLISCGLNNERKQPDKPKPTNNIQSIIFIDKSISVDPENEFINKKYTNLFKEIVSGNINKKGDKIDIYYIHENTSKAKVITLKCKSIINRSDTLGVNQTDIEIVKNKFDIGLRKERRDFLKRCVSALDFKNETGSNKNTDVWASLLVIDKLVKPESDLKVKVYYLSDMIESMDGKGRRDFHKLWPKDRSQAENWAKEDFQELQQKLEIEKFENIEIKIALPFPPSSTAKENNPNVGHYWQTLFSLLGVGEAVEEY